MAVWIDADFVSPGIDFVAIAAPPERADGWREVSYWSRFFDRNQAIIMLTATRLLETGRSANDPVAAGQGAPAIWP